MSLINQMLQDLDSRRAASGARSGLPNEVRPLPPAREARWPLLLAAGICLLAVVGALAWYVADLQGAQKRPGERSTPPVSPVSVAPGLPLLTVAPVLPALPAAAVPEAPVAVSTAEDIAEPRARKLTEREAQLRFATTLHLPSELKAAPIAPAAPVNAPVAAPALAASPAPAKLSAPTLIEKSAPSGTPRERAEAEYRKALGVLNQGRLVEAIDGLRAALKQDATHAAPRQLLLKLLVENKRLDEAAELLQEGLQLQPAQISWAMSLARLQVDRGDLPAAWVTLQRSLPAAANSADYQGFAAHVLQRLGRYKESAEYYQAATRLAPGEGRWWLGLGLALEADGHPGEAREAMQRAKASGTLGSELLNLVEQKLR
jgi:MSHA biogenesis protein MshN